MAIGISTMKRFVKNCGCVEVVSYYDDFPGERYRYIDKYCDRCLVIAQEEKRLRELKDAEFDRMDAIRCEARKKHLEYLNAIETDGKNVKSLNYFIDRVVENINATTFTVDMRKSSLHRNCRKWVVGDDVMAKMLKVKNVKRRYYCDGDIVDKCDIALLVTRWYTRKD